MNYITYSSLNPEFLPHYKGSMDVVDKAIVYFNPHALQIKKLPPITIEQIKESFANDNLEVYNDSNELFKYILSFDWYNINLLMMSSGNLMASTLTKLLKNNYLNFSDF